jgi:hypothetical protein
MSKSKRKRNPQTVLRLPDLEQSISAVLNRGESLLGNRAIPTRLAGLGMLNAVVSSKPLGLSPGMRGGDATLRLPRHGGLGDHLSTKRGVDSLELFVRKSAARPLYVGASEMGQTREFVRKQIEAMKSGVFELGLFRLGSAPDGLDAEMLPRAWDSETLLRSIAWLRFENTRGRNIHIRPQGEHHLSLVDDLSRSSIDRMKAEGFQPATIVETSPQNFQAWLNHGERLTREVGTAVARALASRFESDTKAADWRHFGRLAGFTNQKEKYRQPNGLFPFVRLIESTGEVYSEAGKFVANVREQCEREQNARSARDAAFALLPMSRGTDRSIESFRQNPTYGGDGTRVDLAYALYALSRGASPEHVGAAIRSRDLSHKGSERRQEDYVERTIRKALALQQSQARGR